MTAAHSSSKREFRRIAPEGWQEFWCDIDQGLDNAVGRLADRGCKDFPGSCFKCPLVACIYDYEPKGGFRGGSSSRREQAIIDTWATGSRDPRLLEAFRGLHQHIPEDIRPTEEEWKKIQDAKRGK